MLCPCLEILRTFIRNGNSTTGNTYQVVFPVAGMDLLWFISPFFSYPRAHFTKVTTNIKKAICSHDIEILPLENSPIELNMDCILIIIQPLVHFFHLHELILQQESHFYFYKIS